MIDQSINSTLPENRRTYYFATYNNKVKNLQIRERWLCIG